jgi:hypothetical protein
MENVGESDAGQWARASIAWARTGSSWASRPPAATLTAQPGDVTPIFRPIQTMWPDNLIGGVGWGTALTPVVSQEAEFMNDHPQNDAVSSTPAEAASSAAVSVSLSPHAALNTMPTATPDVPPNAPPVATPRGPTSTPATKKPKRRGRGGNKRAPKQAKLASASSPSSPTSQATTTTTTSQHTHNTHPNGPPRSTPLSAATTSTTSPNNKTIVMRVATSTPTLPETSYKRTSKVWTQYLEDTELKRVCQLCDKVFSPRTSTTNLLYHLEKEHQVDFSQYRVDNFDHDELTRRIAVFLAEDCLPFRVVLSPSFVDLLAYIAPTYVVPSPQTFSTFVSVNLVGAKKAAIAKQLGSVPHLALSADGWTSIGNSNFVLTAAHGLDLDFVFRTFLLDVQPVLESETGQFIAHTISNACTTWGIDNDRVVGVVTDGAANMKCAVTQYLHKPWFYCLAHVYNRSIALALHETAFSDILAKAQALANFFRSCSGPKRVFEAQQAQLGIPVKSLKLEIPTRWGSGLKMLRRLLHSRAAIATSLIQVQQQRARSTPPSDLSPEEWQAITEAIEVLQPLNDAYKYLTQQRTATLGAAYAMIKFSLDELYCINESETGYQPVVSDLARAIFDDLGRRFEDFCGHTGDLLALATFLDPATKDFFFLEPDVRQQQLDSAIAACKRHLASVENPQPVQVVFNNSKAMKIFPAEMFISLSESSSADIELERYRLLSRRCFEEKISGPETWWQAHKAEFPLLSQVARKVLSIVPTSIYPERCWSLAGRIRTKFRNLKPSTFAALMLLGMNKGV